MLAWLRGLRSRFQAVLETLDREAQSGFLLLGLVPFLVLLLWPSAWSGSEEHYFLLAHRRVAPEAFSEFHAAFDASNARLVFEYLLGSVIALVGYERAHTIFRVAMGVLYAASFGMLFRALRLSVVDALGAIVLFCIAGQTFIGGEAIIRGVESKTLAYAAVVSAIALGYAGRWGGAILLVVAATYLHFLVGGFWILALALLAFIRTNGAAVPLRVLALSIAMAIPLLVLVAIEQFGHPAPASTLAPAEIYALRVPGPFDSKWDLWNWSPGIVVTGALTVAFFIASRYPADRHLTLFVLALLVYLLAALGLSLADRHTHFFGKFYLFRPASLTLFLALVVLLYTMRNSIAGQTGKVTRQVTLAVFIVVFAWGQVKSIVEDYVIGRKEIAGLAQMTAVVERESKPGEIVLIEPRFSPLLEGNEPYAALHRQIPRPTLVSAYFQPTLPHELVRWHELVQFRKNLFINGCREPLKYPVRLLVVFEADILERVRNCGRVVWRSDGAVLLRVADRWVTPAQ